jgi:D-3-phosphoglycerate dehydrogenase
METDDPVFRVGVTRDARAPAGGFVFGDMAFDVLDQAPGIEWDFLAEDTNELTRDQLLPYDAAVVFGPAVTAATIDGLDRLALVSRVGVGYDAIDVVALTDRGILLTVTPDGVRRPMATAALTLLLALSHKLLFKDKLTREGRWAEAARHTGVGLGGRTVGVIGLGNIGRELVALTAPLGMRQLAADPYVSAADAAGCGAELVELETLLRESDFVCVVCPLNDETHHMIDASRLALMKPTAHLVNIARGPIVDQRALATALAEGRLAGAGLDVFEEEPLPPDDPLLALDNVILAPHALGITDEWARVSGLSVCTAVLDVAGGRVPQHVVNTPVLDHRGLRAKLERYARQAKARA